MPAKKGTRKGPKAAIAKKRSSPKKAKSRSRSSSPKPATSPHRSRSSSPHHSRSSSPKKAKKAAKGAKKRKSPKAKKAGPKRPLNAYMRFAQANRAAIVKAHPKFAVTDVAKELGARWRGMSDKEKAPFQAAAAKAAVKK